MNDIKVFITVELESKDVDKSGEFENKDVHINKVIEIAKSLMWEKIPTQLKITNLPPRRSGFIKASDLRLRDIEKE